MFHAPHTIRQDAKKKIRALTVVAKDLYKKNQQLEESRAKEEKEKGLKAAEVRGLKRNLEDWLAVIRSCVSYVVSVGASTQVQFGGFMIFPTWQCHDHSMCHFSLTGPQRCSLHGARWETQVAAQIRREGEVWEALGTCKTKHGHGRTTQQQKLKSHTLMHTADRRLKDHVNQGLVNVLIEHHPNIGDIISNRYLKVMFKIPQMGHLPNPVN